MNHETPTLNDKGVSAASGSTLLRWTPVLLIALGILLHRTQGSDGVLGVICGPAVIYHALITARRPAESLSVPGRFMVRWKGLLVAMGVVATIGGALDAVGLW